MFELKFKYLTKVEILVENCVRRIFAENLDYFNKLQKFAKEKR